MSPPLSLWSHLEAVLQRCGAHECCVLLLDYDGTLTPIVPHPDDAYLRPAMQELLSVLARHPRYRVAVVSGRALDDLRGRVAGGVLYLAGNHGLEIEGPGGRHEYPEVRRLRPQIRALAQALQRDLAGVPGVLIEDKGMTLSVHYRRVPAACVPTLKARFMAHAGPAVRAGGFRLGTGKAVLEVRPHVPWDKGEAVRWIVERLRQDLPTASLLAIYVGDDDTDEDAFRVLTSTGIGIVVGSDRRHSAARYFVESVEEVERFLKGLSELTWPSPPLSGGAGGTVGSPRLATGLGAGEPRARPRK
jgi:alpha,alpha-trehalase